MNTVLVAVDGGLGNQLFQFSAGYALARRLDADLVLDLSGFENAPPNRQFELRQIPAFYKTVSGGEALDLRRRIARRDGMLGRLADWPGMRRRVAGRLRHCLHEKNVAFDPSFRALKAPALLTGHFVSERYFSDVAEELATAYREWLEQRTGLSIAVPAPVRHDHSVVSVHVRLTDYLDPALRKKFAGSCDVTYYQRAIATARRLFGDCDFRVFSDDTEGARRLLAGRTEARLTFMESKATDPALDLARMASSHHHIIANSTYSWWAAWLNPNPAKTVLAPRHWFARAYCRRKDCADVVPPDWLTLECDGYCV